MKIPLVLLSASLGAAIAVVALRWPGGSTPPGAAPPPAEQARRSDPKREPNVLRYPAGARQLESIKVAACQAAPLPLAEPLNGRLAYNEDLTARISSPIAGRIVSIKVQPGDSVSAGSTLSTIDSPDLATALADRDKAKTDAVRKRLALERARALFDAGVLARKELESAQADFDTARAEEQRAQLRLRNLGPADPALRAGFALRTPISGTVAERRATPGLEVRPDLPDPLFVISDIAKLWIIVDVPERFLGNVREGMQVQLEVDAYPGVAFPARVARVGATVDPATRRVPVRAEVDNPERRLKPEMYGRVTLLSEKGQSAVRVPNTALVTQGVHSYVFVEKAAGVFERRRVDLVFQDRDYSFVGQSLAGGERLVVGGALLLNSEIAEGS